MTTTDVLFARTRQFQESTGQQRARVSKINDESVEMWNVLISQFFFLFFVRSLFLFYVAKSCNSSFVDFPTSTVIYINTIKHDFMAGDYVFLLAVLLLLFFSCIYVVLLNRRRSTFSPSFTRTLYTSSSTPCHHVQHSAIFLELDKELRVLKIFFFVVYFLMMAARANIFIYFMLIIKFVWRR